MKRIAIVFILALSGCDSGQRWIEAIADDSNVYILAKTPLHITDEEIAFRVETVATTGKKAEVCAVLKDVPESSTQNARDLLAKVKLRAKVQAVTGKSYELQCPAVNWSHHGRLVSGTEFAYCVNDGCSPHGKLPADESIQAVVVSSGEPLDAVGVYWSPGRK